MLAKRFNKIINIIGLHEQVGFMSGCGCVDATAALKIMLQNLTCAGHEAYVLFVDIIKAFDSVNRDMLWKILAKYGIPENMIRTIKKMYTDIHVTLQVGKENEEFMSTSGVKQGNNLAPFSSFLSFKLPLKRCKNPGQLNFQTSSIAQMNGTQKLEH